MQTDVKKLKQEFFKKGGQIKYLPPNEYSDGKPRFNSFNKPFLKRKPLTGGRGRGVSQSNLIYSGSSEG